MCCKSGLSFFCFFFFTEFFGKLTHKFLTDEMSIHHIKYTSLVKSAYVESFNRTIQGLLAKEAVGHGSNINKHWLKHLPRSLYKYNYVNVHSFIKMTPAEGEKLSNQMKIQTLFQAKHQKAEMLAKARAPKGHDKPLPKYKLGDKVRLWRDKGKFGNRSYYQDFTDEVFEIASVLQRQLYPIYQIKDGNGEILIGNAMEHELTRFIPPEPQAALPPSSSSSSVKTKTRL